LREIAPWFCRSVEPSLAAGSAYFESVFQTLLVAADELAAAGLGLVGEVGFGCRSHSSILLVPVSAPLVTGPAWPFTVVPSPLGIVVSGSAPGLGLLARKTGFGLFRDTGLRRVDAGLGWRLLSQRRDMARLGLSAAGVGRRLGKFGRLACGFTRTGHFNFS